MFLYTKMPARLMSFEQSALTFICPSITVSKKGREMLGKEKKNLKTFQTRHLSNKNTPRNILKEIAV